MLLETSKVGAVVDVDAIPVPDGLDLTSWLKMYPGMGFVVTAKPRMQRRFLEVFQRRGLTAAVIGQVTEDRKLVIRQGAEESSALRSGKRVRNRNSVMLRDNDSGIYDSDAMDSVFVSSLQDMARARRARIGIGIWNADARADRLPAVGQRVRRSPPGGRALLRLLT